MKLNKLNFLINDLTHHISSSTPGKKAVFIESDENIERITLSNKTAAIDHYENGVDWTGYSTMDFRLTNRTDTAMERMSDAFPRHPSQKFN